MSTTISGLTRLAAMASSPADAYGVPTDGTMVVVTGSDPHLASAGRAALEQARCPASGVRTWALAR